jgi:hypothetical protein
VLREAETVGADPRQQFVVDLPARGGGDADHRLGVRRQVVDPRQQHVRQGVRQRAGRVVGGGQELLDEERDALAADVDVVEQGRAGQLAQDRRRQVCDLRAVQRPDRHGHHVRRPLEAGQQQPQRMAARQLVGAVREHDHDR